MQTNRNNDMYSKVVETETQIKNKVLPVSTDLPLKPCFRQSIDDPDLKEEWAQNPITKQIYRAYALFGD